MFGKLPEIGLQSVWGTTNSVLFLVAEQKRARNAAATASFLRGNDRIPTWEELAWRTAQLGKRIDAAKAKHGIA